MIPLQVTNFLSEFRCLAERCEDTCCKGWGMQLDRVTKEKYESEAPELLSAVDTGEAEWIMKRDQKTDYCIKFDQGICSIHRDYGTAFLGDACHFYPRISRRLGTHHASMTATLSCPEITRLALFGKDDIRWQPEETDRLPASLSDYLVEGLRDSQAWAVHEAFLSAMQRDDEPVERSLSRLVSVAHSLSSLPVTSWPEAVAFYLNSADGRLPAPEPEAADPFNLLHLLYGLVRAAKPSQRPRLDETLADMAQALEATIDPTTHQLELSESSLLSWQYAEQQWQGQASAVAERPLRRWIQTQMTMMLFPFSGPGRNLGERATLLALRFAVTRLAMICASAVKRAPLDEAQMVRITQSLSRFIDHLADPTLTLEVCRETGWIREARLRALIGDGATKFPSAVHSAQAMTSQMME